MFPVCLSFLDVNIDALHSCVLRKGRFSVAFNAILVGIARLSLLVNLN